MISATLPARTLADGNPLDIVKKLISDKSEKTSPSDKSESNAKIPSEPSRLGEFCVISGYDGSLRTGRCNGAVGGGLFIAPTSALGDKITQGMVIYKGQIYPVNAVYKDSDYGVTVLFADADACGKSMTMGKFPEAGSKLLVNSQTKFIGEVRDIYGIGAMRAIQLSGEVDEENFVGCEVYDARGRVVGIVTSCEVVYDKNKRADICYILPSSCMNQMANDAFKNKVSLQKPAENILSKITSAQFQSYSQARQMLYLRRYPQAIKLLRKLLNSKPVSAYAYRQLGDMYFEQHDFPRAAECYKNAIDIQPSLLACYPQMAQAMGKTGQPAKALDILLKCSKSIMGDEMKQTFAESFRLVGLDLIRSKLPQKAVVALQNADRLEPGNAEICFALAEALMDEDQLLQARDYYVRFVKLAGPAWREYTLSSQSGGDAVMDPRVLRAQRRINEIDYKIRMRETQK